MLITRARQGRQPALQQGFSGGRLRSAP